MKWLARLLWLALLAANAGVTWVLLKSSLWPPLVPLVALLMYLLLVAIVCRVMGVGGRMQRADWRDLGLLQVNEIIVLVGGNFLALWGLQTWHGATHATTGLAVVATVLLLDLASYWLHRWSHTWQFLWIFHAWHHTCDELNSINAFRFHLLDRVKTELVLLGLVLALDLPFLGLLWYLALANAQNVMSHCALARYDNMPWQRVLNTPWLHYWHHSYVKPEQKHNYGSILSIWDTLFDTRLAPSQASRPQRLGTGDVQPTGLWRAFLYPLKRLLIDREWR